MVKTDEDLLQITTEKLINSILADMMVRLLSLSTVVELKTGNRKERIIAQALYIEYARTFNTIYSLTHRITGFNLDSKLKLQVHKLLKNNGYKTISMLEFDELFTAAFGEDRETVLLRQELLNKQQSQIFQLVDDLSSPVFKALETLVKHGVIERIMNLGALVEDGVKFSYSKALPRGNSAKGVLVAKFLAKGHSKEKANELADKQLTDDSQPHVATVQTVSYDEFDTEMQAAIEKQKELDKEILRTQGNPRDKAVKDNFFSKFAAEVKEKTIYGDEPTYGDD